MPTGVETPRYLGKVPHPAVGIRIPEILLEGILTAFKETHTAGGLMLSYGRETAPEYVINAPPGEYEITTGHTGTSIRKYLTMGAEAAKRMGVVVEMEADHLTVTSSSAQAVKRISGVKTKPLITEEEVREAIKYIKSEVDEAASTGYVCFFTLDTCELIDYSADQLAGEALEREFWEKFGKKEGERILGKYGGKTVCLPDGAKLEIPRQRAMQLALKYKWSLDVTKELYEYIKSRIPWPFGVEIAFDETPSITPPEDMFFYLGELAEIGVPVDFIAPNVGFEKKKDYTGDLKELEKRVRTLSAIAQHYGAMLCFHSGSGSSPYSGKGEGTYEAILRATGGKLKYKISGVYIELVLELLASQPSGSRARKFYEELFDAVYAYVKNEVESKGPLYSPVLERQLGEYEAEVRSGKRKPRDPRAEFFRYYSFIAFNLRDEAGRRPYREGLVELYESDPELKSLIDREVKALTLRLINGLGFGNNLALIK